MKRANYEAAVNNAEFWHSFAYLACIGKRNLESFCFAQLGGAKDKETAAAIVAEAKAAQAERIAAANAQRG